MARPRPEKRDGGHVMASLEIRTAEELSDPAFEARWAARRAARETDVLRGILLTFVERGGPIHVEEIVSAFPDRPSVLDALAALDADDLIRVQGAHVDVAYPFAAAPPAPFLPPPPPPRRAPPAAGAPPPPHRTATGAPAAPVSAPAPCAQPILPQTRGHSVLRLS